MTPTKEKVARLEALLARIQNRAAEPRPRRAQVSVTEAAKPMTHVPPSAEPRSQVPTSSASTRRIEAIDVPARARTVQDDLEATTVEVPIANVEAMQADAAAAREESVSDVSGEFAVAAVVPQEQEEEILELEELGPADEITDEPVVEIKLEPSAIEPSHRADSVPPPTRDRASEPPESGRELVASPHESARLAVAAPATPDPNGLDLDEEHAAPPESSRNLRAAPAVPPTSDVVALEPGPGAPPLDAIDVPPLDAPIPIAPEPAAPEPIAIAPEPAAPEPIAIAPEPAAPEPIAIAPEPAAEPDRIPLTSAPQPPDGIALAEGVASEPIALAPDSGAEPIAPEPVAELAPAAEPAPIAEPAPVAEPAPTAETPIAEPAAVAAPEPAAPAIALPMDLTPASEPPPTRTSEVPVVPARHAPEPQRVAASAALVAEGAHAAVERVTVPIDAVRIDAQITPADVAAIVAAAREPRPETFGVLLDAALDL